MIGRAMFGAASLLCIAASTLSVQNGRYGSLIYIAAAEAVALIGFLLTTRRPANPVSWVLAASGLWWAMFTFFAAYAVTALVEAPGSLPAGRAAAWIANWGWLPGLFVPLCAMLLLVPDGRLISRRWMPAIAAMAAGTLLGSFAASVSPTFDLGSEVSIENPLAFDSPIVVGAGAAAAVLLLSAFLASVLAFILRYRLSTGEERQQLHWIGLSLVIATTFAAVGSVLWDTLAFAPALPALALLALPTGIAIAVLRYRLYDIDRVVSRTLVYGCLTVVLVGAYVGLVVLGQAVFSSFVGGSNLVIAASTLVVAALFLPVRSRVQGFVDRRFYRSRYDAQRTMETFGARLREQVELDGLVTDLRAVVAETMQPAHTSVWL
ncbi:MAG: hypothetical protein LH654_03290, partial [Thermoleophilia bacterium]|nr:hypothetical protein [Thermoleophilia bacterium]